MYERVKRAYYWNIGLVSFCILGMIFLPMLIEGYAWWILIMPIGIQLPLILNGRRVLKEHERLTNKK
jgi:hypothetical protein